MASDAAPKNTLVLHFDINKTIIMCDPVKNVGSDAMINALLSEACWGTWDDQMKPADAEQKLKAAETWKYQVGPTTEVQSGMVTYGELLEEVLRMDKAVLQDLKNNFTEPGFPGVPVRSTYLELQSKLLLPPGVTLPRAPAAVGEGRHFLVPSFLKLVQRLQEEGRNFRIIFRTFGIDIEDVISEFALFCSGKHPCFTDVPSEMHKRTVRLPQDSGEYYRDEAGLHLSMCTKQKGGHELVQLVHGTEACAKAVNSKLFDESSPTLSMAIRDYFPYWKKNKESDNSGKPLIVEAPQDGAAHHIFFDDNIERDRAHIVDARNARTGEELKFSETQGVYLIKAEPVLAIRDLDYFINAVALAEQELSRRFPTPQT